MGLVEQLDILSQKQQLCSLIACYEAARVSNKKNQVLSWSKSWTHEIRGKTTRHISFIVA